MAIIIDFKFAICMVTAAKWWRILHEYSCFIEFIKRVVEEKNARLAEHLSLFRKEFNKFNNTGA